MTLEDWKYRESDDRKWSYVIDAYDIDWGDRRIIAAVDWDEPARLFTAAPDLLYELQNLARQVERDNLHTTAGICVAGARAAIAKATGQDSV